LDAKSLSWNDLNSQEKKSIRSKFYTMKRAAKLILMFADSYPSMPEDPTRHKEVVRRVATSACERLQDAMGKKKKTITAGRLEKPLAKEENKNIEKNGKLPGNAPEDAQRFFESD